MRHDFGTDYQDNLLWRLTNINYITPTISALAWGKDLAVHSKKPNVDIMGKYNNIHTYIQHIFEMSEHNMQTNRRRQ